MPGHGQAVLHPIIGEPDARASRAGEPALQLCLVDPRVVQDLRRASAFLEHETLELLLAHPHWLGAVLS